MRAAGNAGKPSAPNASRKNSIYAQMAAAQRSAAQQRLVLLLGPVAEPYLRQLADTDRSLTRQVREGTSALAAGHPGLPGSSRAVSRSGDVVAFLALRRLSPLNANRVRPHKTSVQEIDALRDVVERDLKDARIPDLSADRRFATAYNAVLQLTKMAIACEGYRVVGLGHHQTTFEAHELAVGQQASRLVPFFDSCRRKRNQIGYDMANVATESEVTQLLRHAAEFHELVEAWIRQRHPEYSI